MQIQWKRLNRHISDNLEVYSDDSDKDYPDNRLKANITMFFFLRAILIKA